MAKKQPPSPKWHTVKLRNGDTVKVRIVRKPKPKGAETDADA
jgi:hypothetical protein